LKHDNDNGALRYLSVCSGIEAASVAWHPLGWCAIALSEIEAFPSAVLAHHYPTVPNLGDFTKIDSRNLGRVDVLCGGTPCQAFSVAGARQSLADDRGNLTLEFVRLAHELAAYNGLRNVVWENVPGVLSTVDNAFGCFLAGLVGADGAFVPTGRKPVDGVSTRWWRWSEKEEAHAVAWPSKGMVAGPEGRAAWRVLDAQFFGLAQRRERVIVVADFGGGADPAAVLFERAGVHGNTASGRKAGQGVAGTIAGGARGSGGYSTDDVPLTAGALRTGGGGADDNDAKDGRLVAYAPDIARCVATREGSSQDFESTTMIAVGVTGDVAHTLTTEGADASEDGTGRGTPIVAFNPRATGANVYGGKTGALDSSLPGPAIAQTVALRGREGGATAELGGGVATALRASKGGGDKPHVLTSAVRRLTPRECERLQGFPDDYTRIPMRWYKAKRVTRTRPDDMWERGTNADGVDGWWLMAADGQRYKALGNSWAVPKFRWVGERIARFMPAEAANDNEPVRRADVA
jgi:DNA (cytosine-5)-methyltransferase 1